MPNINLTWMPYYKCTLVTSQYRGVSDIVWKRADNNRDLNTREGLYVIENAAGQLIYVGQADNWFTRFAGRNRVLREFRLAYYTANTPTNPVSSYRVKLAKVTPAKEINVAETFLIRISYKNQNSAPPILLQNINGTTLYTVPSDGLKITHTANNLIPSYFESNGYEEKGGAQI